MTDNHPILVDSADLIKRRTELTVLAASGAAALVVPLLGWWYHRRNGSDRRFGGLPPGVLPGPDENVPEVRDSGVEVPVAFAPPALPLAEAACCWTAGPRCGRPPPR